MTGTTTHPHRARRAPSGRLLAVVALLTACCCLALAGSALAWQQPVNISPPTITGTAQQGKTLTEHHGTWMYSPTSYSYQWLRCNSSGAGCVSISGATGEAYVPVAEDVGHELRVDETAYNPVASAPAESEATVVVVPPAPVDTTVPTITGTAQQGQTLTEHHGEWANSPTGYTYRWQRCSSAGTECSAIGGATSQTYIPVAEDVGHKLRVTETASNAGGSGSAAESKVTAVVVPPVPVDSTVPTVTGSAQQGQTLTEHHGEWSNSPTAYTYQWLRCEALGGGCLPIAGATNQTYSPVAEDVGHKLRVTETASNAGGSGSAAESAATALVVPPVPVDSTLPTVTGSAQQGQTLTEHHGEWSNSPTAYSYQWMRCNASGGECAVIGGATNQTYSPVAEDVGHKLRVAETASNAGGSGSAAESAATAVVVPPVPVDSTLPTVTGSAQQGQTLTEHHGEWSNSPTAYSYQWMRCNASGGECAVIGGATNQTYVSVGEDIGHELRVSETASNAGGSGSAAESAATALVVPPVPVDSTLPTVTGSAQQGQTLTEHHGEWSNSPTAYSYQWMRCNASGGECAVIGGATNQTYVSVGEDIGHELRVSETASNAGGSGSAAESAATALVVPPVPVDSTLPTVTGSAQQGQTLTEHHGEWSNSPTAYSYQWMRCNASGGECAVIGGATNQTYVSVGEDIGHELRVSETASNAGGSGSAAESAATALVVPPAPVDSTLPTVTGTAQQGQTLTEDHGEWTSSPTAYTYQWMRCSASGGECAVIGGATSQTYVPVSEDVGHELRVTETASNAGGYGSAVESEATSLVMPPVPVDSTPPTVTGTTQQGQTLSEHQGEWTDSPTGYSYQWLRCDSSGAGCVAIGGASGETYSLVGEDVGHTLRVAETASNAGGAASPAESEATAVVTALAAADPPSPTDPPADPPADPPVDPPAGQAPTVVISISAVRVDKHGNATIPLSCPATASTGCKGKLVITYIERRAHAKRAVASLLCARGCRQLGKANYEAKAGQKVKIRVHIASAGRHLLGEGKTVTTTLTATSLSEGHTTTVTHKLALEPANKG